MDDPQLQKEATFACFHAGPIDGWMQYRQERPTVPLTVNGKQFLKDLLGLEGLEISLNAAPAGRAIPFLHRHEENREVYIVIRGRGQFLVEGKVIDVQEGSVLRIEPSAARAWRNYSDGPFCFYCLQYPADSIVTGGTKDGRAVEGKPVWPEPSSEGGFHE